MACGCCKICDCPCSTIKFTISGGCTSANGDYTLTADSVYGNQCLYTGYFPSVSGGPLTIKFNCASYQVYIDYGGNICAIEGTLDNPDPFTVSGSCSQPCGSMFFDITCDTVPVDCTCCNFADGDTLDAIITSDACPELNTTQNLVYNEVGDGFSYPSALDLSLHCNGGTWIARILGNIDADSTIFSCSGNGSATFVNSPACPAGTIEVTFTNLVSTTNMECLDCCDFTGGETIIVTVIDCSNAALIGDVYNLVLDPLDPTVGIDWYWPDGGSPTLLYLVCSSSSWTFTADGSSVSPPALVFSMSLENVLCTPFSCDDLLVNVTVDSSWQHDPATQVISAGGFIKFGFSQ